MSTKHAARLAFCVAAMAFAIAFVLPAFVTMPVLWYQPAERAWVFDVKAAGIAMDFYGRCLNGLVASVALGAVTYALTRRVIRCEPNGRVIAVFTGWALTFTLLVMAFFAWRLIHRTLVAPPVPAWYQPR